MNANTPEARQGITWFVSRHPGAIEWAKDQGLAVDRWVEHLDPAQVKSGDAVFGTLPVNLAAEVCERGAYYLHLSLKVPEAWRGRELTADDLQRLNAQIKPYHIKKMSRDITEESA